MMNNKSYLLAIAAALLVTGGTVTPSHAAYDENLHTYTLDTVVVNADRTKNQFGDTITEQSYYRTGGDVKVITREEIDKRHYTDITEAIKRIPGVTFQNPGYRGGEYGYQFYNNGVSINGDTRVIILVDGRRVDNAASGRIDDYGGANGSKSTGVNLDQVTNMENIDKIEVIKGPGASAYGADATGGVINIITRKGGQKDQGSIDLATGSWKKHHYAINYSGSAGNDKSWHYFISANRDMSGNTKYKDSFTDSDGTLEGSKWKEDGVNLRVDKDFNDRQNLKIWYNHREGKDGYPIAVPNQKYMNEKDWTDIISRATIGGIYNPSDPSKTPLSISSLDSNTVYQLGSRLAGDTKNPGYHNLYSLDGNYGSYSRFRNNDYDIVYTFNKENGMESFVRYYYQSHWLTDRDKYQWYRNGGTKQAISDFKSAFPNGATGDQIRQWIKDNLAPFTGDKSALKQWIQDTGGYAGDPTHYYQEKNHGIQLQYAKSIGINDVIADFNYDTARAYTHSLSRSTGEWKSSYVKRKTYEGYVQDKIHLTDKWDLTPSLRYVKYSSFEDSNTGKVQGSGDSHAFTYALNTEYMFNDTVGAYLGVTKVYRPIKQGDYSTTDTAFNQPLKDEKGVAWTFGIHKDFSPRTTLAVHYDYTHMSNSIANLPVLDPDTGDFENAPVNAKENKQSFNVTLDHQFNDHVTLSASYSHMKDKWKSKDYWTLGPEYGYDKGDINTAINSLRPENHYALNLSYQNGGLYTGLLANWYTGCSDYAFTSHRFLVLDWNINYDITKDLNVYAVVGNLTNEAYETSYNSWNGKGSSAMPGRYFMIGTKYKF